MNKKSIPESTLDTLEPKNLPEPEEGPLTEIPNPERFTPGAKASRAMDQTRGKIKEQTSEIAARAKDSAKARADSYVEETCSHLRNLESATRRAGEQLDDSQPQYLKKGVDLACSKVDEMAGYFERNDSAQIAADAKQFVRQHPAAVLGGLALAGFCAGRFIKATEPDDARHEQPNA